MNKRTFLKYSMMSMAAFSAPTSIALSAKLTVDFINPTILKVNDIDMAVYEQGKGLPVIFCHGFPELAYTWRHQMASVAEAGFRAIAPDLRGFGLSDQPKNVSDYAATKVCDDLVAMMDAMKIESAIFCGHDWGGFIVDTMNLLYPDRVRGLIGIGAPHHYRPESLPSLKLPNKEVLDKQAYNDFMQIPEVPEKLLNSNPQALFRALFRDNYFTTRHLAGLPESSPLRKVDLATMIKQNKDAKDLFVSQQTLDYYTGIYAKVGFAGGIQWYRAMGATWEAIFKRKFNWKVDVPYLYLWPSDDPINVMGLNVGMEDYIKDLEKHKLVNGNHFVMEQKPKEVSVKIVDWLNRKFKS
ncbi:alpha/beta hydrolase [Pleionea sp. CnH1-48]|uniref:alpha/beta hydrolase n=1 Tax=Pleionea sp. CnH1-48 TaxID=2954494 RepID=UPI002097CC2C|nr:alpha/beta hydrolase [Pleionea sp. CnH1-48]MCO7226957.1 alpha/beta hydrolase [Pleionea sp. CnH1-48]